MPSINNVLGVLLPMICGLITGPVQASGGHAPAGLEGSYEIVAVRRASDVAGPVEDATVADVIGKTVSFDETLQWLDGRVCAQWRAEKRTDPAVNFSDPILSDTQVGPIDGQRSTGDKRLNDGFDLICGDGVVASLARVDNRVLVTSSASGVHYFILEKQLAGAAIKAFQTHLASMKFFNDAPKESWDEVSLRAVAAYAEYRGAKYRFRRPAITQNLLDGLDIPGEQAEYGVVKIVHTGEVSAYFYGEEVDLAPREFGVRRLAFRFDGDNREYAFTPAGDLFETDWRFDIFSPNHVLLLQDRFGPYHVVRLTDLKAYLTGDVEPNYVVGDRPEDASAAAVLSEAVWTSPTSFDYVESCCGERRARRWSMPEDGGE